MAVFLVSVFLLVSVTASHVALPALQHDLRGTRRLELELFPHKEHIIQSTERYDGHIQLVVARYEERMKSLGWIRQYPHIVYNRGKYFVDFNSTHMKENVGREGYVYLHHLINNYDQLANVTVFLQGDSSNSPKFVHSPTFRANVENLASGNITLPAESDGFAFLGVQNNCMSKICQCINKYTRARTPEFITDFDTLLNFTVPNPRFAPQALFAVTREAVHRNPVGYYANIMEKLSHENNPFYGYFVEGAWPEIFHSTCGAHETDYFCFPGPPQAC